MSDDPRPTIRITCPKCKATVMLEVRDEKNWSLEEANIPDQCIVLLDHLTRTGNPGGVLCGILETAMAEAVATFR